MITHDQFIRAAPGLQLPELSRRMGRDRRYLNQVLHGRITWTDDIARQLTGVLTGLGISLG